MCDAFDFCQNFSKHFSFRRSVRNHLNTELAVIEEHIFVGDEVSLNYAEGPSAGPPLVMFHGVLRCWQDFMPLIPSLGWRWQVLALDQRGHGKSEPTADKYHVRDYVRDAVQFVRDAVDEPVVIYGHSLGAMVAAAVAARLPDKVRGIVLEDPPFDTMGTRLKETSFFSLFKGISELIDRGLEVNEMSKQLAEMLIGTPGDDRWIRLGDVRDPVSLRFMAKCLTKVDPQVLEPIVEGHWLEDYHRGEILDKIECPTLLLRADSLTGGMLPKDEADRIAQTMSRCTLVQFPKCGHIIHWERTEATLQVVSGFLESL